MTEITIRKISTHTFTQLLKLWVLQVFRYIKYIDHIISTKRSLCLTKIGMEISPNQKCAKRCNASTVRGRHWFLVWRYKHLFQTIQDNIEWCLRMLIQSSRSSTRCWFAWQSSSSSSSACLFSTREILCHPSFHWPPSFLASRSFSVILHKHCLNPYVVHYFSKSCCANTNTADIYFLDSCLWCRGSSFDWRSSELLSFKYSRRVCPMLTIRYSSWKSLVCLRRLSVEWMVKKSSRQILYWQALSSFIIYVAASLCECQFVVTLPRWWRVAERWETTNLVVSYDTPMDVIELLKTKIATYINTNSREWSNFSL